MTRVSKIFAKYQIHKVDRRRDIACTIIEGAHVYNVKHNNVNGHTEERQSTE